MEQKVRISQCMIVKNEEKNISQALSWGKHIMWEQIVVDTGSVDRTVELAENMGAKVFHYKWTDDFAAAKNFAIAQAKGDWIAFLDADEYILQEEAEKIPAFLESIQDSGCLAFITPWVNINDGGNAFFHGVQMRFFRNWPGLRYAGRIHENLALDGKELDMGRILDTNNAFSIYHTGYSLSNAGDGNKARRNRRLIELELEKYPGDSRLMGYLGDCYRIEADYDNAILWYERAISVMTGKPKKYDLPAVMTLTYLMMLLGMTDRQNRLREIYRLAVKGQPLEPDFDYIMGRYYTLKGEYERGVRHLERAFGLLEQRKDNTTGSHILGNLAEAWEMRALCYYHIGNLAESVRCCANLLRADPFRMSALKLLLFSFQKDIGTEQILGFLSKLYDLNGLKERLFIMKAAVDTGLAELSQVLRGTFQEEELAYLEQSAEY